MQYKIQGSVQQIQILTAYFSDYENYKYEVKYKHLHIYTGDNDDCTIAFLSTVSSILKQSVSIDYMTQSLIKFVIL